ncbi:iron chelate uptake ABC transporter family permease subunit [Vibrio sp. SCSIO 43136]|uniref:iron chelate uptake ABC transporter family permease subunit n=1 Tax=Vibrio sp. SCSIO 43136 TaxID=2819101 RepID=UPI002075794A|nr:iron chelate uptake ABC transporter family permease subunit [Vibrio sp. SCSIO 43136]USD63996.1 iron chelate uptake ABC transporter family permease subunit [Vibrio sp. SCSIO 43136]
MSDRNKLILLGIISLIGCALYLGHGLNADNYQYFLSRRIPKVIAMILASFAIAQSSLVFQTITHNRILTPSIMGFDALFLLTQVIIVLLFGGMSQWLLNDYLNFSVSMVVMMAFSVTLFGFYFHKERRNILVLLLIGVIFGQFFYDMGNLIIMVLSPNDFFSVQEKMFASFNNVNTEIVYLCVLPLLIASILLWRIHHTLDVFWLDKDNTISLGVDPKRTTRYVMLVSSVLIAISTAVVGPILFFGILVTNLTREIFSTYRHKTLLIGCSLLSVSVVLAGQWVVERVLQFDTTLSVIINFVGGIYFLILLSRNKVV